MVVCGNHHMYNVIIAGMLSAEIRVYIWMFITLAAKPGVKTGETEEHGKLFTVEKIQILL